MIINPYVFATAGGGGSYPTILSNTQSDLGSSLSTAHLVAMPATVVVGDLLMVLFVNGSSATVTTPAGWTLLNGTLLSGIRTNWFYKVADGTEGGTTVDFVTSSTSRGEAQAIRIQAGTYTGVPVTTTPSSGGSANPNPPSLTSGFGAVATLWIASVGSADSNTPSGYSYINGQTNTRNATTGSGYATASTCWNQVTAATEDPGAFTLPVSRNCIAHTVAVRGV